MEKRHEHILNVYGQELKTTLNIPYLLDGLVKRKLLTDKEEAQLKLPSKSSLERNEEFLNILKTKGSRAFAKFLETLQEEDQHLGHEDLYEKLSNADKKPMSSNSSQSSFEMVPDRDSVQDQQAGSYSPTHSRPRSRSNSASSIGTQLSAVSEARIMAATRDAMESLKNHVDQSMKNLESRITTQIDILKREVQYLKSRPGSSRGSSSTLESSSGYSAYEGDFESSGGSDTSLYQRRVGPHWPMQKRRPGLKTNTRHVFERSSISGSSSEIQKINDIKYPQPMRNNSLLSSESNDYVSCSEIIPEFDLSGKWEIQTMVETTCTCKQSQVPPIINGNMIHFVTWNDAGITRKRIGVVRENIRSYDIAKSSWDGKTKPIGKFSSRQCIYCMLWYSEQITLLANKVKDIKPSESHSLALYGLNHNAEMPSWKEVPNSDISLSSKQIDPDNCIGTQHEHELIVISYSSKSNSINFHIFSNTTSWKSTSVPLSQSKLPYASNIIVQLQSSVISNNKIYYSLKYGDQIQIYQSELTQIDQNNNILKLTLENEITQCLLSAFNEKILLFCMYNNSKSFVEVEALDSKSLGKFTSTFSSTTSLVAVETFTIKGETDMIMVCHNSSDDHCYIKTWKITDVD